MNGTEVLLALAERDPFIRANFVRWDPADGVLTDRAGAVLTSTSSVIISGEIAEIPRLLDELDADEIRFALTPIGSLEYAGPLLAEQYGLVDHGRWVWMYSRELPPVVPGEEFVTRLDGRLDEVAEAISEANPESHAAQNLEEREWWGYQRDGHLLAVCGVDLYAAESTAPEAAWCGAHLSGFGTRPQARRQGVGAALMAGVSRHFIAQYGIVHFGVWDDNQVAMRIYRRLGYSTGAHVQNFGRDVN